MTLIKLGVADIFRSAWFLFLIGMISVNILVGSITRVFPKLRLLRLPLPFLGASEIARLPVHVSKTILQDKQIIQEQLVYKLKKANYRVSTQSDRLNGEFGKYARLAASITHVGLLTLLVGVSITAWSGFSGFKPVPVGSDLSFSDCQHASCWVGTIPKWRVHVNSSRRENYDNGDAKQWYSNLSVVDSSGHKVVTQDISVNNPLSYEGVDIYQSSWDIGQLEVSFNGRKRRFDLRQMGKVHAAFLPLDDSSILIFSLRDQNGPLRVFAKRPDWPAPKLIGEVASNKEISLGGVKIGFFGTVATTGLQYKCDPGLIVALPAFFFIAVGVLLAAIPHRQIFAELKQVSVGAQNPSTLVTVGGHSRKAKWALEKQLERLVDSLLPTASTAPILQSSVSYPDGSHENLVSKGANPESAELPVNINDPAEVVHV